jgi:hypothetical protein
MKSALMDKGAVNEVRTRDLKLGKLPLYQLSYYRNVRTFPFMRCKDSIRMVQNQIKTGVF